MKKNFVFLLVIFMCLFLVGCGSNESEPEEDVINDSNETYNSDSEESKIELYSDDTKMVFKNGEGMLVYYYSGDKITGYEAYVDYGTAAMANYALSLVNSEEETNIKRKYTNGRYLVIEYAESEYENLTYNEVKSMYSYLELLQKNN